MEIFGKIFFEKINILRSFGKNSYEKRKEKKYIYILREIFEKRKKKLTKGDMGGLVNNVLYLVYYINHCYCSLIFCFNTYCLVMYFTSSIGRCMGNIYENFLEK